MLFQHLIGPRTKESNDGSVNRTISRRLKKRREEIVDELFPEIKTFQLGLTKASKDNQFEVRLFNRLMQQGKGSSALQQPNPDQKFRVLSLSHSIGSSIVLDNLKEKAPSCKRNRPGTETRYQKT